MAHTVPFGFSGYSGLDVGRDNGLLVDRSYADKAPFAFTGTVKKVVFDVAPHPDGNVTLKETGDHLGRKGMKIGGGVGPAVGLFAPPLLASAVVDATLASAVRKSVAQVGGGSAKKLKAALAEAQVGMGG